MDNTRKIIGLRINSALAERGVKQKELATHLGVKDNVVSYYCSGERTPNTEQLIEISRFLNVTTDYLLGMTNALSTEKSVQSACDYTGLSEKAVDFFHSLANSGNERKIEMLRMANMLFEDETFGKMLMSLYQFWINKAGEYAWGDIYLQTIGNDWDIDGENQKLSDYRRKSEEICSDTRLRKDFRDAIMETYDAFDAPKESEILQKHFDAEPGCIRSDICELRLNKYCREMLSSVEHDAIQAKDKFLQSQRGGVNHGEHSEADE